MSDDYTEGPWIVDGLLVRAAENNEVICCIEPWSEDTDAADARLIAAAPDLLAALRAILPFIPTSSVSDGGPNAGSAHVAAADKVRAAIAAATGVLSHEADGFAKRPFG